MKATAMKLVFDPCLPVLERNSFVFMGTLAYQGVIDVITECRGVPSIRKFDRMQVLRQEHEDIFNRLVAGESIKPAPEFSIWKLNFDPASAWKTFRSISEAMKTGNPRIERADLIALELIEECDTVVGMLETAKKKSCRFHIRFEVATNIPVGLKTWLDADIDDVIRRCRDILGEEGIEIDEPDWWKNCGEDV